MGDKDGSGAAWAAWAAGCGCTSARTSFPPHSLCRSHFCCAASFSVLCSVLQQMVKLTTELAGPLSQLQAAARLIAGVSCECGLEVDAGVCGGGCGGLWCVCRRLPFHFRDASGWLACSSCRSEPPPPPPPHAPTLRATTDEYVQALRPSLMDGIHAWSKGATFAKVCELMPDIFEGSIIRAARRLDELMQQLEKGAAVVGDTGLAAKFAASRATIRRGLMFSASLCELAVPCSCHAASAVVACLLLLLPVFCCC